MKKKKVFILIDFCPIKSKEKSKAGKIDKKIQVSEILA